MRRGLMLAFLIATVGFIFVGCGGGTPDAIKNAPPARPSDVGPASAVPMGVSKKPNGNFYLVKKEVDGQIRIWALGIRAQAQGMDVVVWNSTNSRFATQNGSYRYDIDGNALHKISAGEHAGEPAPPLKRFRVEVNPNGNLLVYQFGFLSEGDRDNPEKGAYVVVEK